MTDLASLAHDLRDLAQRAEQIARSLESGLASIAQPEAVMTTAMQATDTKLTLTQHEFSAMLGIQPRTLRRKVDEGVVPAPFRVGKKPLWRRAEIESWLAKERGP